MKTINYIAKKPLANVFGLFGLFYGLIIGILMAIFATFGGAIMGGLKLPVFGGLSLLITPIIYGAAGYLSGYVAAQIYNKFIVPKLGGIQIELG